MYNTITYFIEIFHKNNITLLLLYIILLHHTFLLLFTICRYDKHDMLHYHKSSYNPKIPEAGLKIKNKIIFHTRNVARETLATDKTAVHETCSSWTFYKPRTEYGDTGFLDF